MVAFSDELGLASRWGWIMFRGVIAILFGLLAFAQPGVMGVTLLLLFAAYAFVGGIAAIVSAARRGSEGESWGMLLLDGLLGVAVGVAAMFWPKSTAMAFVWVLGVWALVTGIFEIGSALSLRKFIDNEWALGLAGGVSVAFGLLMLLRPLVGGLVVVYWLGTYAIVFGIIMVTLGFHLRSFSREHHRLIEQPG